MSQEDIEARFELYLDAIDVDSVRYHYISKGVLEQGEKKVEREGRYDTERNVIELRGIYYVDDEVVEKDNWVQMATVDEEGRVGADGRVFDGENLKATMAQFLRWEFFSEPKAELGEIFYDVTGHK